MNRDKRDVNAILTEWGGVSEPINEGDDPLYTQGTIQKIIDDWGTDPNEFLPAEVSKPIAEDFAKATGLIITRELQAGYNQALFDLATPKGNIPVAQLRLVKETFKDDGGIFPHGQKAWHAGFFGQDSSGYKAATKILKRIVKKYANVAGQGW